MYGKVWENDVKSEFAFFANREGWEKIYHVDKYREGVSCENYQRELKNFLGRNTIHF